MTLKENNTEMITMKEVSNSCNEHHYRPIMAIITDSKTSFKCQTKRVFYISWPHRFGHLFPSFPESKDGGVLESCTDLEHSVEIVEAATNVGNRHPLLDDSHATLNRTPRNDFGDNQLRHLGKMRDQNGKTLSKQGIRFCLSIPFGEMGES